MGPSVTVATAAVGVSGAIDSPPEQLVSLTARVRETAPVDEELVPLTGALEEALGLRGLRRGRTVVLGGPVGSGAVSLGLALLAGATSAGMWCAVVGLPDLGVVAASELGVDLGHLVLVADPGRRASTVLASLIEGCEVVLAGLPLALTRAEALRLAARARQRRVVLVVLAPSEGRGATWPEVPDVTVSIRSSSFFGIGPGSGRILGRALELVTAQRRAPLPHVARWCAPSATGVVADESGLLAAGSPSPPSTAARAALLSAASQ